MRLVRSWHRGSVAGVVLSTSLALGDVWQIDELRESGKSGLVLRASGGRCDDGDDEALKGGWVDALAARSSDSPFQVLSQEGNDKGLSQASEDAAVLADHLLQSASERNGAGGDDLVVHHAILSHDSQRSDEVLVEHPLGRILGDRLAVEQVDGVRAVQGVARSFDVGEVLEGRAVAGKERVAWEGVRETADDAVHHGVDTVLETELALGGSGDGIGVGSVEAVDIAADGVCRTVGVSVLGVGVGKDCPVGDIVGGPPLGVASTERKEGRAGALGSTLSDSPSVVGGDLATAERVGVQSLPHSEDAVNVGVVKPEDRVEGAQRKVSHVATRNRTSWATCSVVHSVVNSLQRAPALSRTGSSIVVAEVEVVLAGGEELVDLVLQAVGDVFERVDAGLSVAGSVCAVRVGVSVGTGPGGEWAVDQVAGVGKVVAEERVWCQSPLARWSVDSASVVTDDLGEMGAASRSLCSPVPVWPTHDIRSVDILVPSRTSWVLLGDVLGDLQEFLLEKRDIGAMPAGKEDRVVGAVAIRPVAALTLSNAVPVLSGDTMNRRNTIVGSVHVLSALLPLLHGQNEQIILLREVVFHLTDFETWLNIAARAGNEDGSSILAPVQNTVNGLLVVLGPGVCESGRGKGKSRDKSEEPHDGQVNYRLTRVREGVRKNESKSAQKKTASMQPKVDVSREVEVCRSSGV